MARRTKVAKQFPAAIYSPRAICRNTRNRRGVYRSASTAPFPERNAAHAEIARIIAQEWG